MLQLQSIHHIAIICSDIEKSKYFYTEILGLKIEQAIYRAERDSWKIDLSLNGKYCVELFSFPNPPKRPSRPEASGLRHLAFSIASIDDNIEILKSKNIFCEPIRIDEFTNKKFTFIFDPDDLPIEMYEM
jgi:glyoxylase I family protein